MSKPKQAKISHAVQTAKNPIVSRWPTRQQSEERISWRLGDADLEGPFPWTSVDLDKARGIHKFMAEMEKLSWGEALQGKAARVTVVSTSGVCSDAFDRLTATKRDDTEDLVEFRLSGVERIWGVRRGNACHVLWWDPDHEVWPSTKKHT